MGILVVLNYIYPAINAIHRLNYNSSIFLYYLVIITYLCVIFLLWSENDRLEEYNLDRLSITTLIIFAFLRYNLTFVGEIYYKIVVFTLGLVIALLFIFNFHKIPRTKPVWIMIGILSCLLVIPFAYINAYNPAMKPVALSLKKYFWQGVGLSTLYGLSFVSIYEEIIFRGILFGWLRKLKWADKTIIFVQAFLFWLLHFWQASAKPFDYFILLPLFILATSLLLYYSKQVFSSILLHTAVDSLVDLITRFYLL